MTADVFSETIDGVAHLQLRADVSGFILDVDASLPDYVLSLIDVYRQGQEQIARFNASSLTNSGFSHASHSTEEQAQTPSSALPKSNIFASLLFRSGRIRLHSSSGDDVSQVRSVSFTGSEYYTTDLAPDTFKLPELSVWGEYRMSPTDVDGSDSQPSVLIFKATVHSSENTLLPATVLPFLAEFNQQLEKRMRATPSSNRGEVQMSDSGIIASAPAQPPSTTNLHVSLSLRIDKSRLVFTCQPDVNVNASVNWESGGFVVNISPGLRAVAFTGNVEDLTISLKHGFLTEDCATVAARNLVFTTTFLKAQEAVRPTTLSLVVDTELSGAVRFSRLQDLLCFKAVWLDRIPVFTTQTMDSPTTPSPKIIETSQTTNSRDHFFTSLLLRLRHARFDVDLGQSISSLVLDLDNALVQTRLTEALSELSLRVGDVLISASGNIAGKAHVPDFMFQTVRMPETTLKELGRSKLLELCITSGPLDIFLESEHQQMLQYR
jgi:hypothetical protein